MRKIPTKNYLILFIIVVLTIVISAVLFTNYSKNKEQTTEMYELISEIKEADLDDYLKEKDRVLIYVADKYDLSVSKMENKLISEIKKHSLIENFVYLDSSNLNEDYLEKAIAKYNYDVKFQQVPFIIVFVDNTIKNVIYIDKDNFDFDSLIQIEDIK